MAPQSWGHFLRITSYNVCYTKLLRACFGCTIACGRISQMDKGHFTVKNSPKYWDASGGLEYEAAWALGAANGVGDLETLQYANMLCNEDGMDPISFGATIGAVMELYRITSYNVCYTKLLRILQSSFSFLQNSIISSSIISP